MAELHIATGLALPSTAVTETFGLLGTRGAGKSNAAVVLAEEMWDAGLPWVAVDPKGDWYGVRSSADGKAPGLALPVFGGLHGDVPLEATGGALIADLIVDRNLTAVLDVSDFSKADRARFLVPFFDRLYRRHRADPQARHVFLEEAHEYIPQQVGREEGRLKEAAARILLQGRSFGLGCSVCSQRSARLHKDVLTQVGTLIAMRTLAPQDRKAIEGWVSEHDVARELMGDLPGLAPGEAWVWSPSFLGKVERISFRRRRTFDSGGTPTVGAQSRPPATLADVDLAAIKEAMAETIERAQADDPKALRKRIAELERQVAAKPVAPAPEVIVEQIEVIGPELLERFESAVKALGLIYSEVSTELAQVLTSDREATLQPCDGFVPWHNPQVCSRCWWSRSAHSRKAGGPGLHESPVEKPAFPQVDAFSVKHEVQDRSTNRSTPAPPGNTSGIGKTERNVLSVLVLHGALSNAQIALLAGYSVKASTIGVALGKLRKAGLVDSNGQPVRATEAGVAFLGSDIEALPQGRELLEFWRNRFGLTERRVLDALVEKWPNETSQAELAEMTGYSASASTIGVALGKLRKVGVVDRWRLSAEFAQAVH